MSGQSQGVRRLIVILGDQLDENARIMKGFSKKLDMIWMGESSVESNHVWSSKMRIAFFLSAMRHFRDHLQEQDYPVHYHELDSTGRGMGELLIEALAQLSPEKVLCTLPGDWRVKEEIESACREAGVKLEIQGDEHFFDTPGAFREWADSRKSVRLEYYYRELRKRHDILMTKDGKPVGGEWNFDKENRGSFGKKGPGSELPAPCRFKPDAVTREVIERVEEQFGEHPGKLDGFDWPVTREAALEALDDFIKNRLVDFGRYQDAMWTNEPFLYHSLLSASLNVKLLNPREVIAKAVAAYEADLAPLNAVEGFVRQILGWREFVRGVYWWKMPDYLNLNALEAGEDLPGFYWTGETDYHCLADSIRQTLDHGYAHHIQRLMVTGLYGLLLGVDPKQMHQWYLSVYVDAIEWVELPNTLGMSQFADHGIMASKPYAATGKYINRMSNYCNGCPADPAKSTGENACPFTTLYWDFLHRHRDSLSRNPRMRLQLRNLERLSDKEIEAIGKQAEIVRAQPEGKRQPA